MPRTSYNESVHAHSLTFSTQHKLLLFKDLYLCDIMLNQIALARKRGFYKLYAYVFMPNHVHLVIIPPETTKHMLMRKLQVIYMYTPAKVYLMDEIHR